MPSHNALERICGWKSGPLGPRCSMKIDGLQPWWNVRRIYEMGSSPFMPMGAGGQTGGVV